MEYIGHEHAYKVVSTIFESINEIHLDFAKSILRENFVHFFMNKHSSFVIEGIIKSQRCTSTRSIMMGLVMQHVESLSKDKFSNYMIQVWK